MKLLAILFMIMLLSIIATPLLKKVWKMTTKAYEEAMGDHKEEPLEKKDE